MDNQASNRLIKKHSRVVVTGASFFLERHRFLFEAIARQVDSLEYVESKDKTFLEKLDFLINALIHISVYLFRSPKKAWRAKFNRQELLDQFTISRRAFVTKTRYAESRIHQLNPPPNWILQVFALSSPLWERVDIPYVYYLDHTMALAEKVWSQWMPYDQHEYQNFLECERIAFQRATHLFSMSQFVRTSLIEDYGIDPKKITVVGSSGNFKDPYIGDKTFGSKRIVFNGSDFHRKGGDIVLDAFKLVKQNIPEAKLCVIGRTFSTLEDGIENPGHLNSDAIAQLFLSADLVVAPARWDPFPGFIIEAMNYGVPCIVSANGGMPEIVDHEVNGIVLSELTPEALAEQIITLLKDPPKLQVFSQKARKKVETKLNWDTIANTIVETISQLI